MTTTTLPAAHLKGSMGIDVDPAAVHVTPTGTTLPLECAHVGQHHSDDHVLVSAGQEPFWACGFHVKYYLTETIANARTAGCL